MLSRGSCVTRYPIDRGRSHIVLTYERSLAGELSRERFGLTGLASVSSSIELSGLLAELGEFGEGIAHGEEALRIAYVALTRAERYCAVALPANVDRASLDAYLGAGFVQP